MILINVFKNDKFAFSTFLSKRDARRFLKRFKGEKEFYFSDKEFDFDLDCIFPTGYFLEVYEYRLKKGEAYERAIELMDGDLQ
jgi:hypothetical protein